MTIEIKEIKNNVGENISEGVLNLIRQNADKISINVFPKKAPIYSYMAERECIKAQRYLDRVGDAGSDGAGLLVALDNDMVVGYLLYVIANNDPSLICLLTTVVDSQYRNRGIMSRMISLITVNARQVSLSCEIPLVAMYQNIGFRVASNYLTQIGMMYGESISSGEVFFEDDELIAGLPSVLAAKKKAETKDRKGFYRQARAMDKSNQREAEKAEKFYNQCT